MSVVVVSNNFLSEYTNNGKTLDFLLSEHPREEINWIYTTPLITDSCTKVNRLLVKPVQYSLCFSSGCKPYEERESNGSLKKSHLQLANRFLKRARSWVGLKLIRELLFLFKVRKVCDVVVKECRGSKVEKVLFVAGDFSALHTIAARLSLLLDAPLHVFITDDYVFEYQSDSSYRFRKGLHDKVVIESFRKTLALSSSNSYISEKMRAVYKESFGADGALSFNSVRSYNPPFISSNLNFNSSKIFRVRYFGSVHSGRLLALEKFLELLGKFNEYSQRKLVLDVFSVDPIPQSIKRGKFSNLVNWFSPLSGEELQAEIASSDALALIESNRLEDLRKTWLSFSTKVMEYLGSGKPIVASGPLDNPSIEEVLKNDAAINLKSFRDFDVLFDEIHVKRIVQNGVCLLQSLEEKNTLL